MRSPSQYEMALAAVAELQPESRIRPNESVGEYLARQRKRSVEDIWNDATIRKLHELCSNVGREVEKGDSVMADYWLRRIFEIVQEVEHYQPVTVEFLSSVPAGAGNTEGAGLFSS